MLRYDLRKAAVLDIARAQGKCVVTDRGSKSEGKLVVTVRYLMPLKAEGA
jgi:hypothetical protein